MSELDDGTDRDPLDLLAEQFLLRHRGEERLGVEAFVVEHPEHADALRDLLPTLLMLEEVKRDRASSGSNAATVALPAFERLGDFRIVRELGRGGMGVVFEAMQESLDRHVALKVIPQASLLRSNQLERFRREAQIAARLHHTHIVPVYGSGETDGFHWYAMQFIDGLSLDRWRVSQQDHPPSGSGAWRSRSRFIARLGAEAAGALHFAHSLGTLHRDIKPANFLLDRDDHLWVTDFGLAKALESDGLTHSGDVLGTLQYMAPEQFQGRYDVLSEVYALGVTLHELLALRPAFRGQSRSELIESVQAQRVEPLRRVRPDLPLDLCVIIEKAMAREPADRYADAQQLQDDLEAFLEDRPIRARRLSTLLMTWRWCRRNRGMAALAAAAGAAVSLAAITGWAAYVMTDEAATLAKRESARAEINLGLTLTAFGDMFDALVGRDPTVGVDEDPDTGEQTLVVQSPLAARDVVLLQRMLDFYDDFAAQNVASQSLRYETARAARRVGAIHSRLGGPESLAAAEAAFGKALSGFAGITDRDVRRDIAVVHVDLGQLYQRRGRLEDAGNSFRTALAALEALPGADSPALRLERAKVLFELSRTTRFRPGRGGRGRVELEAALVLVKDLLAESPDDPEVRVLKARCLIDAARSLQRWQPSRQSPLANREQLLTDAVTILRELVVQHPDRSDYRFELCEATLAAQGFIRRRGSRSDPDGKALDEAIAMLRESDALAERLFLEQPLFEEYRALHGRVRSQYGRLLQIASRRTGAAEVLTLQGEAERALRSALAVELPLLAHNGNRDARFVRQVCETYAALGRFLISQDRDDEARQQVVKVLDLLAPEPLGQQALPSDPELDGERPLRDGQRRLRLDRNARGGRGERMIRASIEELVHALDDAELDARLEQLRQQLR